MTQAATARLINNDKSIERALSQGLTRPDRLPGLLMIFGQLPRILVDELGALSQVQLRAGLAGAEATTIGDACVIAPGAVAGMLRAERWRSSIMLVADPVVTAMFVDVATGTEGFGGAAPNARIISKTDRNIIRVIFRRVAKSMTAAFSVLTDVSFDVGSVVERVELEPPLSAQTPAVAFRLAFEYTGKTGILSVVIPLGALEPIRDVLSNAGGDAALQPGSKTREDPRWSKQLSEEVARAFIELNGVLEERPIALGEVNRLAVGSIIELESTTLTQVRLDAEEKPLFWCNLGKRDGGLILRVEGEIEAHQGVVDEFFGL